MIQVWIAETEMFHKEENFRRGLAWADAERLKKIRACRLTEDKVRSLCCGLLLQYALRRTGMPEEGQAQENIYAAGKRELRYRYGRHGKPYLLDDPQLYFNLSHSGAYTAIAFGDREVGIDIQERRPVRDALARRIFSEAEYAHYAALTDVREREDRFFRCWCRKESRGKLTGEGLARQLAGEAPSQEEAGETSVPEAQRQGTCGGVVFRDYQPDSDYYLSVCAAYPEAEEQGVVSEAFLFPPEVTDVTQKLLDMIRA